MTEEKASRKGAKYAKAAKKEPPFTLRLSAFARVISVRLHCSGTHRAERHVDDQLAWPLINSRM